MEKKKELNSQKTTPSIQLIENSKSSLCNIRDEFSEITDILKTQKSYYTMSIIGPQSSGKSTFLNIAFNTKFEAMGTDRSTGRTTHGIWGTTSGEGRVLIFDVEGSNSVEREKTDHNFENKIGILSLVISNMLIINIDSPEAVRRNEDGCRPLLKSVLENIITLFTSAGEKNIRRKKLVFLIRDVNLPSEIEEEDEDDDEYHDLKNIQENVNKLVKQVWKSIKVQGKPKTIEDLLDYYVEYLPEYDSDDEEYIEEFTKAAKRFSKRILDQSPADPFMKGINMKNDCIPARDLYEFINRAWETIKEEETLNVPQLRDLIKIKICQDTKKEQFDRFKKQFECLENPTKTKINQLVNQVILSYNIALECCGEKNIHVIAIRYELEDKIKNFLCKNIPELKRKTKNYSIESFKALVKEIDENKKESLSKFTRELIHVKERSFISAINFLEKNSFIEVREIEGIYEYIEKFLTKEEKDEEREWLEDYLKKKVSEIYNNFRLINKKLKSLDKSSFKNQKDSEKNALLEFKKLKNEKGIQQILLSEKIFEKYENDLKYKIIFYSKKEIDYAFLAKKKLKTSFRIAFTKSLSALEKIPQKGQKDEEFQSYFSETLKKEKIKIIDEIKDFANEVHGVSELDCREGSSEFFPKLGNELLSKDTLKIIENAVNESNVKENLQNISYELFDSKIIALKLEKEKKDEKNRQKEFNDKQALVQKKMLEMEEKKIENDLALKTLQEENKMKSKELFHKKIKMVVDTSVKVVDVAFSLTSGGIVTKLGTKVVGKVLDKVMN